MKWALPFLLIGLLSFGATHAVLMARAATRPAAPAPVRLAALPRPSQADAPPATAGCRQVRVVYAGSVRPMGEACTPRP